MALQEVSIADVRLPTLLETFPSFVESRWTFRQGVIRMVEGGRCEPSGR